ncbi:hypothetical protein AZE42_13650 [Rhizopogon vesiculosus]|uniref:O-methyltransferase C-terminal domain-containing protein n=1 Tax=Rhizopogon vesiculosus TaxID=180088 RepID=A0A1J8QQC8_9AGAM|nr:hypothetical protein AZE42_13650 [Rhizopogon vesiculosus]
MGSTIVDCGGGNGSLAISLANRFPGLRLIVQEREEMVAIAEANIKAHLNPNSADGTIAVEAHDFFTSQPHIGDNYTFMLRHVLHNWPDAQVVNILENLAAAAGPKSKILLIERVSGHFPVTHIQLENNAGNTAAVTTPVSLIGEQTILNSLSLMPHALTLHLLCQLNSHERTLDQWGDMIVQAGLVITGVYKLRAIVSILECRAIQT